MNINKTKFSIALNETMLCMKMHNYLDNGLIRNHIQEITQASITIRKFNNKTYAICKRSDVSQFLDSKVFLYRKNNIVEIFRRVGSPKCITYDSNIIKITVGSYAEKNQNLFNELKEKLLVKRIVSQNDQII